MAYLLDTNVFLQAKNTHYGFDFCPAFWDWIDLKRSAGVVLSVNEVRDELIGRDDEIADWARSRGEDFFMKPDAVVAPSLAVISGWVQSNPSYFSYAKFDFFGAADFALITYAHAHKHTVVTHERPEISKKKVKIPSVCLAVGVEYTSTYSMLRRERARFVLDVAASG